MTTSNRRDLEFPAITTQDAIAAEGVYFQAHNEALSLYSACVLETLAASGIRVGTNATQMIATDVSRPYDNRMLERFQARLGRGWGLYVLDLSAAAIAGRLGHPDSESRAIYVQTNDAAGAIRFANDQLVHVGHASRLARQSGARLPVGFGVSNRLIRATADRKPFKARRRCALRNFSMSFQQAIRYLLDITYVPRLERSLPIDRRILSPGVYLEALKTSTVCLAYCGHLMGDMAQSPHLADSTGMALMDHCAQPAYVLRWDSFRFWEALAAGCLAVQLDFDLYGLDLPVRPVAWVHYAPIDLSDMKGSIEQLLDRERDWEQIAEAGRNWAIEHYGPGAVARRLVAAATNPFQAQEWGPEEIAARNTWALRQNQPG